MTNTRGVGTLRAGDLITAKMLQVSGACAPQLGRFRNVYPKGVRLNTRNLNEARSKYGLSTGYVIFSVATYRELDRISELTGVGSLTMPWRKDKARLIHSAFIKVLKERK